MTGVQIKYMILQEDKGFILIIGNLKKQLFKQNSQVIQNLSTINLEIYQGYREKIIDQKNKPIIMKNLEQIKHLKWEGEFGINNIQTGKWTAFWKGKQLDVGGYYNENGLKIGNWIELFENYWDFSPVTYVGEYQVGYKQGKWDTFYEKQKMQSFTNRLNLEEVVVIRMVIKLVYGLIYTKIIIGDYAQHIISSCKVTLTGEYQNNYKIGRWDTMFQNKIIGSTDYDQNGLKNGIGIEVDENFYYCCQVIYRGEYKNNIKVGRWDTIFLENNTIIGGGNYDIKGLKEGLWVDLHDGFNIYYKYIQTGTYQNGIRQGQFIESQLS
ncbi:unnamed protein product (macronuclear) [Paramecium tetraurelia]|uniref:Uncharacterized protein n=1 Tax=Paramecium tetraurelia TaxID=5888 RepID=A0BVL8_PARTE|nr:uncharacterized protein GSPATT00005831001 [Paramecium tetraurelia]CAK62585.1 unnamed protein product [Paramecium tetraurelia]|eukprot:XP_001429983.1 hypothetical protein (macronuclear) [Paramecium tetraurelia strain d4-2]